MGDFILFLLVGIGLLMLFLIIVGLSIRVRNLDAQIRLLVHRVHRLESGKENRGG